MIIDITIVIFILIFLVVLAKKKLYFRSVLVYYKTVVFFLLLILVLLSLDIYYREVIQTLEIAAINKIISKKRAYTDIYFTTDNDLAAVYADKGLAHHKVDIYRKKMHSYKLTATAEELPTAKNMTIFTRVKLTDNKETLVYETNITQKKSEFNKVVIKKNSGFNVIPEKSFSVYWPSLNQETVYFTALINNIYRIGKYNTAANTFTLFNVDKRQRHNYAARFWPAGNILFFTSMTKNRADTNIGKYMYKLFILSNAETSNYISYVSGFSDKKAIMPFQVSGNANGKFFAYQNIIYKTNNKQSAAWQKNEAAQQKYGENKIYLVHNRNLFSPHNTQQDLYNKLAAVSFPDILTVYTFIFDPSLPYEMLMLGIEKNSLQPEIFQIKFKPHMVFSHSLTEIQFLIIILLAIFLFFLFVKLSLKIRKKP